MPRSDATLHMLCGKIAAGKSTFSAQLAQAERTLMISEDRWIEQVYGMHARKAAGGDGVSDAEFDHATSFFVPPEPGEGFNIIRYGDGF
jgi:predicted kinase